MITPNTASISLSGAAPRRNVDTRIAPGETHLTFDSRQPLVAVNTKSLIVNLPYMLATLTERRRLIRATTDPIRDLVYQNRDTEMYVALELDGDVFDAAEITDLELVYASADGSVTGTIALADYPAVFDLDPRAVVRGQTVNVIRIILTEAFLSSLFTVGLWTLELFGVDADHSGGASWGTMEWEIRSIFDGVIVVPNSSELTLTGYAGVARYDRREPDTGSLAYSGNQPRLTIQSVNAIYVGELTLQGYAPVLSPITVPKGTLTLSGVAPVRTP